MDYETSNPTFEDFARAVAVFGSDLNLVNHPETPKNSPWEPPHPSGTYNLVEIPEGTTQEAFLERFEKVSEIAITCMDKDCARSTWEKLSENKPEGQIAIFSWGGGVIQSGEERITALVTINTYLAQLKREGKLPQLERIHLDDHDWVCGAVKYFLGGVSLPEVLSVLLQRDISPHSQEEGEVSQMLIQDAANKLENLFQGLGVEVVADLHLTDRDNPANSALQSIPLAPDAPRMNIEALMRLYQLIKQE